MVTDD